MTPPSLRRIKTNVGKRSDCEQKAVRPALVKRVSRGINYFTGEMKFRSVIAKPEKRKSSLRRTDMSPIPA